MKHYLNLTLAVLTVGSLAISTNAWGVTCTIKAYDAYSAAVQKGWRFRCDHSTFVPERAFNAISCQGRTSLFQKRLVAKFFIRAPRGSNFQNGWELIDYWVSGGKVYRESTYRRTRIGFWFNINVINTSFKRRLTKIMVKKAGGVCARFLQEAF